MGRCLAVGGVRVAVVGGHSPTPIACRRGRSAGSCGPALPRGDACHRHGGRSGRHPPPPPPPSSGIVDVDGIDEPPRRATPGTILELAEEFLAADLEHVRAAYPQFVPLTDDHCLGLHVYTMETPLYSEANVAMRSGNGAEIARLRDFISHTAQVWARKGGGRMWGWADTCSRPSEEGGGS